MQQLVRLETSQQPRTFAPALYLVGVDESPHAQGAIETGCTLARVTGASLVLVHVVPAGLPSFARAESVLRAEKQLAGHAVIQAELRVGDPAETLCQRARELRA